MNHVGRLEHEHGVAVGVGRRHAERLDGLAARVEGRGLGEGDGRQGGRRRRRELHVHEADRLLAGQALADVLVGDDDRAGSAEVLVAAGVVEVPVGVEQGADRLRADRRHRLADRGDAGRDAGVDEGDVVRPRNDGDVAARPGEQPHARGQLGQLDRRPLEPARRGRLRLLRPRGRPPGQCQSATRHRPQCVPPVHRLFLRGCMDKSSPAAGEGPRGIVL